MKSGSIMRLLLKIIFRVMDYVKLLFLIKNKHTIMPWFVNKGVNYFTEVHMSTYMA